MKKEKPAEKKVPAVVTLTRYPSVNSLKINQILDQKRS